MRQIFTIKTLSVFLLLTYALSGTAKARSWDMKNIKFTYYADHVWLFYQCGDYLYFNHELRNKRVENDRSYSMGWTQSTTLAGIRYCNGYGDFFIKDKVRTNNIQTIVLQDRLNLYYQPQNNPYLIKVKSYLGRPKGGMPNSAKNIKNWTRNQIIKNNRGEKIKAIKFSVLEYKGSSWIVYLWKNVLYLKNNQGIVKSLPLKDSISHSSILKSSIVYTKRGPKILILTNNANYPKKFQLISVKFSDEENNIFKHETKILRLFFPTEEITSIELKGELSGDVFLYYVRKGEQYKSKIDINKLRVQSFTMLRNDLTKGFDQRIESTEYDLFQMPINCKPEKGCMLVNFNYPKNAKFNKGQSQLLHSSYAGRVEISPLKRIPIIPHQMELIGIIEGPPPVPLENILTSLKVKPSHFVLDAARRLSQSIKTSISQTMIFKNLESDEHSKSTFHSFGGSFNGPKVFPIKMAAMGEVAKKLSSEKAKETITRINKTYVNEIQHSSTGDENTLYMKPIGKLIFLKYDIQAVSYRFINSENKVNPNGPKLFSIGKTNIRPIVRQYELLAKQVNPEKYPNNFIVGDIYSYYNLHRRFTLMQNATQLAPGHNYLSFTYNNLLDLGTQIDISTSKSLRRSNTDTFSLESSFGLGLEDIVGVDFQMKSVEERTYSITNTISEGMAINVDMNYVQPNDDERVIHYDFEVYYLQPSEQNLNNILEQLKDTQYASSINREMFEIISPKSRPWVVTYSVSNIRRNIGEKDEKIKPLQISIFSL